MKRVFRYTALAACATLLSPAGGCIELLPPQRQPEPPAPRGPRLSDGFTLHWMTTTEEREIKRGFNWSERFDFAGLPVRRDAVVLYEQDFAREAREKGFEVVRDPLYRSRLRSELTRGLDRAVPARDFDGFLCLDVEFAVPWWGDRTGGPGLSRKIPHAVKYYDAWEKFIKRAEPTRLAGRSREEREHALETSYQAAVREWTTMLVEETRALRPGAKIAFYGIPAGSRHDNDYEGAKSAEFRGLNDEVSYFIDLADCIMLPLYQDKSIVRGLERQITPREITEKQGRDFITSNIKEAKRLAKGKPVYVLAMMLYPDVVKDFLPHLEAKPLNPENLDAMFRQPKAAGADGIIIWSHFDSAQSFRTNQREFTEHVAPVLRTVVDE